MSKPKTFGITVCDCTDQVKFYHKKGRWRLYVSIKQTGANLWISVTDGDVWWLEILQQQSELISLPNKTLSVCQKCVFMI